MRRLVVVGNGMAGMACVEQILKHDAAASTITVFGDETHVNYNRILLSSVLAGEKAADDIVINALEWYQQHGIDLRVGVRIVDVDPAAKTVTGNDGSVTPYDMLLLATGSTALHAAHRRARQGRRLRVPHARRHARAARALRPGRQGRRDRRRAARPRGRARAAGAGLRRHRRAPDVDADGAAARSRRRPVPARQDGGPRHPRAARPHDDRDPRQRPRRGRGARPTTACSRPTSSSSRPASVRTSSSRVKAGLDRQPRHRRQRLHGDVRSATSSPSASASSIAASATASWRRSSSRARCWRRR